MDVLTLYHSVTKLIKLALKLFAFIFNITNKLAGHNIEIGAQWIHGKENNPIYDFAEPLGLVDEETKSIFL